LAGGSLGPPWHAVSSVDAPQSLAEGSHGDGAHRASCSGDASEGVFGHGRYDGAHKRNCSDDASYGLVGDDHCDGPAVHAATSDAELISNGSLVTEQLPDVAPLSWLRAEPSLLAGPFPQASPQGPSAMPATPSSVSTSSPNIASGQPLAAPGGKSRRWMGLGIGLRSGLGRRRPQNRAWTRRRHSWLPLPSVWRRRILSTGRRTMVSTLVVEPVMCPSGHLIQRVTPGASVCVICDVGAAMETYMWGCHDCNYLMCDRCGRGEADWSLETAAGG